MSDKNYYDILGLKKTASNAEIKSAYRKLAKKFHPDVSKEKNAEARFKELGEAYETLKDAEKRAQYDDFQSRGGRGGFNPRQAGAGNSAGGADPGNFGDMFEELLRGRAGGGAAAGPRPRAGRDVTAELQVSLEDIHSGESRTVELNLAGEPRSIKVKIPVGAEDGQQIRLRGQGFAGSHGGAPGDLYLKLSIAPHPVFERSGRDVVVALKLAPWEAALGGSFAVPTLGGAVKLKVAGGAQSGQRLRLKSRGLPGDPPGDQFVELAIVNPPLTPEVLKAFEELALLAPFDPRA